MDVQITTHPPKIHGCYHSGANWFLFQSKQGMIIISLGKHIDHDHSIETYQFADIIKSLIATKITK